METDAELVRRARRDPSAFGELYNRHAASLHAFVRSKAPDAVAVELTAETFAQAALGLARFRDEADGSAGPWLFGIARNLVRRYYERERIDDRARRRLGMPIHAYELDLDELDERLDAERLVPPLSSALASLPEGQRNALELRVLDELPYRDVAERLGVSEGAARVRVLRALNSLTKLLKGAVL